MYRQSCSKYYRSLKKFMGIGNSRKAEGTLNFWKTTETSLVATDASLFISTYVNLSLCSTVDKPLTLSLISLEKDPS